MARSNQLQQEITRLGRSLVPTLLALPGCGPLSAAKLLGEVAGAARFRSRAAFARWNRTAPIPVWSGNAPGHRFKPRRQPSGERRLAPHRAHAVAWVGPGRAWVHRRLATGDTKTEALRLLRRQLSDEVFRRLLADETLTQATSAGKKAIAA
jgi:transposase